MAAVNTIRRALAGALLLAALGTTGCQRPPDRGQDVDVGGCAPAHIQRSPTAPVLDVTTDGCLGTVHPVRRLAGIAWLQLPDDIDVVRIRSAGPDSAPTMLTRADLERRHGPTPRPDRDDDLLFLLLPVGLLAYVSLIVLAAYGAVRAGVFVAVVRPCHH